MKSLRRKGAGEYHRYLRSRAWFARRKRWFTGHQGGDGRVGCVVCLDRLTLASVQLHHVDYSGVSCDEAGRWVAGEADEDLVAMCGPCHEDLHVLFDTGRGWSGMGRRTATRVGVGKLQRQLARALLEQLREQAREKE